MRRKSGIYVILAAAVAATALLLLHRVSSNSQGIRAPEEAGAEAARPGRVPEAPAPNRTAFCVLVLAKADRKPISGARVVLGWGPTAVAHVTDTSGTARFGKPPYPEEMLTVRKDGYTYDLSNLDAEATSVTRLLQAGAGVDGRVLLAGSRQPVQGARVRITDRHSGDPLDEVRVTGDDGRFHTAAIPPHTGYVVAADVYGRYTVSGKGVAGDGRTIDLVVGGAGRVRGLVREPAGGNAAWAQVYAVPITDTGHLENPGRTAWSSVYGSDPLAEARVDLDGSFEMEGLPIPDRYVLVARTADGKEGRSAPFVLDKESPSAERTITVHQKAALTVHVLGPDGAPVPGAWISAMPTGPGAVTDAKGSASLYFCPPGTYWTTVYPKQGPPAGFHVTLKQGKRAESDVSLRRGVDFSGTVTDASGRPLSGISVRYEIASYFTKYLPQSASGVTGEDGAFHFSGLQKWKGDLYCADPQHRYAPLHLRAVPAGETPVTVHMQKQASVSGRLDPAPRHALLRVAIYQGGERTKRKVVLDQEGRFTLGDLPIGARFRLRLLPFDASEVDVPEMTLEAGQSRDVGTLTVHLAPERAAFAGVVKDRAGRAVEGARVEVGYDDQVEFTDRSGGFRFESVREGKSQLTVRAEGYLSTDDHVEVRSGGSPLSVSLRRAGRVEGRVRNATAGWVAALESPTIKSGKVGSYSLPLDLNGAGAFGQYVEPGRHRLVLHRNGKPYPGPIVDVVAGKTTEVSFSAPSGR